MNETIVKEASLRALRTSATHITKYNYLTNLDKYSLKLAKILQPGYFVGLDIEVINIHADCS